MFPQNLYESEVIAAGSVDKKVCHIVDMEILLCAAHLFPLVVASVVGVNFSEGFHCEIENQLKGGNSSADLLPFQGFNKAFSFCHWPKHLAFFLLDPFLHSTTRRKKAQQSFW